MSASPESAFERLPPLIAEAITERGFTALTAVQERVLDPALEGVDLRISSQTGSGKTVALGLLLAPALAERALARKEATREERRAGGGAQPFAIMIAPTRELAAQLGRELSWLYAKLKVGVAVVAGGASYRDEMRSLGARPLVVVGTPGRLKDHLERGSVDASAAGCVVLDEADQMLDLGFREELEAILGMLPEERRTHLMSATFPREVLALANRYQRSAVVVEGTNLGAANSDITHVAHLVYPNEREAALINLLLMVPGERTLMFVRTRADATDLSSALTQAGFFSLPLSGELEQRERNKTLEAFRTGAVSTLVATDVAARGLDIPEVGRVIHVDPPSDAEGLTHRSGRTGRAGKKGTSIILVAPAARARVSELFRRARVEASWQPIPTPKDVLRAADDRVVTELLGAVAEPPIERLEVLTDRLMEEIDPRTLVRLLLARTEHGGPCEPRAVTPITPAGRREGPAMSRGQKRAATEAGGFVPFRINWGEAEGADKRRILALVCRRGRVTGDQIGAIRVGREGSSFDVAAASAEMFAAAAKRYDPRNPELRIEPDRRGDRPAQAEAHERRAPRAPAQAEERAEHRDNPREHAPKERAEHRDAPKAEPRERTKEHHAPRERAEHRDAPKDRAEQRDRPREHAPKERAEHRERAKEHHAPRERAEPRERTKEHHAPRERAEHRPPERSEPRRGGHKPPERGEHPQRARPSPKDQRGGGHGPPMRASHRK